MLSCCAACSPRCRRSYAADKDAQASSTWLARAHLLPKPSTSCPSPASDQTPSLLKMATDLRRSSPKACLLRHWRANFENFLFQLKNQHHMLYLYQMKYLFPVLFQNLLKLNLVPILDIILTPFRSQRAL